MTNLDNVVIGNIENFCNKTNLVDLMSNIHYNVIFNQKYRMAMADKTIMLFSKGILLKNFPHTEKKYINLATGAILDAITNGTNVVKLN